MTLAKLENLFITKLREEVRIKTIFSRNIDVKWEYYISTCNKDLLFDLYSNSNISLYIAE